MACREVQVVEVVLAEVQVPEELGFPGELGDDQQHGAQEYPVLPDPGRERPQVGPLHVGVAVDVRRDVTHDCGSLGRAVADIAGPGRPASTSPMQSWPMPEPVTWMPAADPVTGRYAVCRPCLTVIVLTVLP